MTRWFVLALLAACGAPTDEACTCKPDNVGRTKRVNRPPLDGKAIVAALRKHRADTAVNRTPRDIKVDDDELRFALMDFCQPCGHWVGDRLTMEEMFPFDRLDDAVDAVCMGLVLRDGTTAYGSTRPRSCR